MQGRFAWRACPSRAPTCTALGLMQNTDNNSREAAGPKARQLSLAEFVPLMALATAIDALSIDAMLPALPAIGARFGVSRERRRFSSSSN